MKKLLLLVLLVSLVIVGCSNKENNAIDTSKLRGIETKEHLEEKGYDFSLNEYTSVYSTLYTVISNDNIWIQRIDNPLIGKTITFKNELYNDKHADILYPAKNTEEDTKEQYSAYEKWLKEVNLSDSQIIEVLNYYYENGELE